MQLSLLSRGSIQAALRCSLSISFNYSTILATVGRNGAFLLVASRKSCEDCPLWATNIQATIANFISEFGFYDVAAAAAMNNGQKWFFRARNWSFLCLSHEIRFHIWIKLKSGLVHEVTLADLNFSPV
jgi:hypothetical protein